MSKARQDRQENDLIAETYNQVLNEITRSGSYDDDDIGQGQDTYDDPNDPAFNPTEKSEKTQAIAALKQRLAEPKGQLSDVRQVVDSMLHKAKVLHPAEVEHILKTTTPSFTPEQIQAIMTPLSKDEPWLGQGRQGKTGGDLPF